MRLSTPVHCGPTKTNDGGLGEGHKGNRPEETFKEAWHLQEPCGRQYLDHHGVRTPSGTPPAYTSYCFNCLFKAFRSSAPHLSPPPHKASALGVIDACWIISCDGSPAGGRWQSFDCSRCGTRAQTSYAMPSGSASISPSAVWTVPAGRMKMRRPHRVPLGREAIAILRDLEAKRTRATTLAFSSLRSASRS